MAQQRKSEEQRGQEWHGTATERIREALIGSAKEMRGTRREARYGTAKERQRHELLRKCEATICSAMEMQGIAMTRIAMDMRRGARPRIGVD